MILASVWWKAYQGIEWNLGEQRGGSQGLGERGVSGDGCFSVVEEETLWPAGCCGEKWRKGRIQKEVSSLSNWVKGRANEWFGRTRAEAGFEKEKWDKKSRVRFWPCLKKKRAGIQIKRSFRELANESGWGVWLEIKITCIYIIFRAIGLEEKYTQRREGTLGLSTEEP